MDGFKLDWTSGYGYGIPTIYPENDWFLQLGTSTSWVGLAFIDHVLSKMPFQNISDRNFKTNINYSLDHAYKILLKLKPASYNFLPSLFPGVPSNVISKYCGTKQYGLLAQDVQNHLPELVEQDSASGIYSLNYIGLIPILIDAVQRQKASNVTIQEGQFTAKLSDSKFKFLNAGCFGNFSGDSLYLLFLPSQGPVTILYSGKK